MRLTKIIVATREKDLFTIPVHDTAHPPLALVHFFIYEKKHWRVIRRRWKLDKTDRYVWTAILELTVISE